MRVLPGYTYVFAMFFPRRSGVGGVPLLYVSNPCYLKDKYTFNSRFNDESREQN